MSKTIEEISKQYVREKNLGYVDVNRFLKESLFQPTHHLEIIAERYAQSQTQELTAWKESASKVFKNLDLQAIGKTLGIGLGEDVSVNVLPKIKELQEQNAELVDLVERCRDVIYAYNDYRPTATGNEILQAIQDRLTKHNHLKSNTNG